MNLYHDIEKFDKQLTPHQRFDILAGKAFKASPACKRPEGIVDRPDLTANGVPPIPGFGASGHITLNL